MTASRKSPEIKTPPAVVAPLLAFGREIRGMLAVPLAFYGGIVGSLTLSAATVAFFLYGSNLALASGEDDEEFPLDFQPGTLVRIGIVDPDAPEKQVVEETRAADEPVVDDKITKEEEPPPSEPEEKPKKPEKPKEKSKEKPDPTKNKDVKVSDRNRDSNTPFDDLPNVKDLTGDPFGDPGGWSDLRKDGDPWATGVMKALNGMKIPAYAAQGSDGTYKFKMKVCKDGRVEKVLTKDSSGKKDLDNQIRAEVMRLRIPKPPPKIVAKMKKPCVMVNYLFTWTTRGVR